MDRNSSGSWSPNPGIAWPADVRITSGCCRSVARDPGRSLGRSLKLRLKARRYVLSMGVLSCRVSTNGKKSLSLKSKGPQGYLWVKTPDSAAGLRVDSPWISLCHPWLRERVDNPWNVRSSHTTGFLH
ncbi:MAG: hypothetical protein IIB56_19235 [Planctomycetes bacterium]|nr:hypothetical protein [Planctomycetota bacterium]